MLQHTGKAILLDIEGTTSAVSFVYDVMFPFARKGLHAYLEEHWGEAPLAAVCEQIATDAGHASVQAWQATASHAEPQALVRDEVIRLMDADIKATGLKQLQGLIWEAGFVSGEMQSHVFDDVPIALQAWRASGVDLRIYSSGSIHAQKLFFGHVALADDESGSLLANFSGHYDTTIGSKRESSSYKKIVDDWSLPAADVLFLSDVVAELDAAREAGLATGLMLREGNAPVAEANGHPELSTFAEIEISK